jgi:hypothetical protein
VTSLKGKAAEFLPAVLVPLVIVVVVVFLRGYTHAGDVAYVVTPAEVAVGGTATATITNTSDKLIQFGVGSTVWAERGGWHPYGDSCFYPAMLEGLRPGASDTREVHACTGDRGEPKLLEEGLYRVVKDVESEGDSFSVAASFRVVDP